MSVLLRGARLARGVLQVPRARGCAGHSDFERVSKVAAGGAPAAISDQLTASKVVLYMKGSPSAPACGFSWRTVQVLDALAVPYKSHNVLEDDALREGIKAHSAWPTIPQLYVDGEFVGGCDIVESMARSGELKKLFDDASAYAADA